MVDLLLLIIIKLYLLITLSLAQIPAVTLFSGNNCNGENIVIEALYELAMKNLGWDDKARSLEVVGTWIFFEREAFNSYEDGRSMYFTGDDNTTNCINSSRLQHLSGEISSLRYVGLPWSYKDDALNIYEIEEFQGDEIRTEKDMQLIQMQFQASLIISGFSAWTLYDKPGYKGKACCINATDTGQPIFVNDYLDKNIPYHSIRSARIGCFK